MQQWDQIAELL